MKKIFQALIAFHSHFTKMSKKCLMYYSKFNFDEYVLTVDVRNEIQKKEFESWIKKLNLTKVKIFYTNEYTIFTQTDDYLKRRNYIINEYKNHDYIDLLVDSDEIIFDLDKIINDFIESESEISQGIYVDMIPDSVLDISYPLNYSLMTYELLTNLKQTEFTTIPLVKNGYLRKDGMNHFVENLSIETKIYDKIIPIFHYKWDDPKTFEWFKKRPESWKKDLLINGKLDPLHRIHEDGMIEIYNQNRIKNFILSENQIKNFKWSRSSAVIFSTYYFNKNFTKDHPYVNYATDPWKVVSFIWPESVKEKDIKEFSKD